VLPCAKVLAALAMFLHSATLPSPRQAYHPAPAPSQAVVQAVATDIGAMDRWALSTPPSATQTVCGLAAYLTRAAHTDTDRARVIYRWITANVRWFPIEQMPDAAYLPQDARTILRRRTAVCAGYANLFAALAKAAGLNAQVVVGTCRGSSWQVLSPDSLPHAWNAVMIEGSWRLIDVSWSTPGPESPMRLAAQPEPETFYFFAPPERLIHTHFPDNPRWQLLPRALTRAEHERLLVLRPAFYRYGLQVPAQQTWEIKSSPELRMRVGAPREVIIMAMLRRGNEVVASERLADHNGSGYEIAMDVPPGQQYALNIYAKYRDNPGMFQQVLRLRVDVTQQQRIAARSATDQAVPLSTP
jgi:transglutaminase/protease-like cytokinesis protein 3